MSDKLFIAIGVSKAKGLPTLPGVWRSVRDLVDWASVDHDIVEVTDETGPVDVARIKQKIEEKLGPSLSRIVLYFVGHGYSVPPDQYLILSAGPGSPDQRIARDGLRDMLSTYGPRQITVITDACMVRAPLRGWAASVLEPGVGEIPDQTFDGFYATQDDTQAYAFRATASDSGLCLFSWVLHRALTCQDETAYDAYEAQRGREVITSYSLGNYLDKAVPAEASARKVWQKPQTTTGFRPPDHIYVERIAAGPRPVARDLISEQAIAEPRPMPEPRTPLEDRVRSEWRRPLTQWAYNVASVTGASLILRPVGGERPQVEAARDRIGQSFEVFPFGGPTADEGFATTAVSWTGSRSASVLLTAGDVHALIPLFRDLFCIVQSEPGIGPTSLAWGDLHQPPAGDEISALEALKGLLNGQLSAADIPGLANSMRREKHRDPMKGIISAYLYDSIGDVENIRRMCWYYFDRGQDVPFDIALLARLPFFTAENQPWIDVPRVEAGADRRGPAFSYEPTEQCLVTVAGRVPVLRAGWSKLRWAQNWANPLAELADHLTENPLTTFSGEAARSALLKLL